MAVNLFNSTTVTFVNKTISGVDAYGNDVYSAENVDVPGCAVNYGNNTEDWQGTAQITEDVVVYAPIGTIVDTPWDQMIIGGTTYNVVGTPRSWSSPFSGTQGMDQVQGRLVTTGGAAT
jgi:hypothetical protein